MFSKKLQVGYFRQYKFLISIEMQLPFELFSRIHQHNLMVLYRNVCMIFFVPLIESRRFLLYARQMEIRGVDIDNPYYNYIISFTVPDIDNVTVVDYDAFEQRIYWSDVRTQTIKRAFINGTGVETVVSAGKGYRRFLNVNSIVVWCCTLNICSAKVHARK